MRIIDEFPPYSTRRYDYALMLDGRTWELEHGIDFNCQPSSLVGTIRQTARRRGVPVEVRRYVRREDRRPVVAVRARPDGRHTGTTP